MKNFLTIVSLFLTLGAFAQSSDAVANALKAGDVAKFTNYFGSSVDVKLPQKNEMKSVNKASASDLVQCFFNSNKITGCELFLPARELNGMTYVAGKLKGAQDYNITVVLKNNGNKMEVITVRIV